MAAFNNIIYEKRNRIATVTLNRPEKLNALSQALRDELDQVVDDLEVDDETRVVIIKGSGRSFCAGYDLGGGPRQQREPEPMHWDGETPPKTQRIGASWNRRSFYLSCERWRRLMNVRQATIAQVHGHCLAGGNDLIASCDIVFAAEDAQIGQPQARAMGELHTFAHWPIHLGMRKTKEWLFTGDSILGKEAEQLGLINHAVPADQLDEAVRKYAERVALLTLDFIWAHKDTTNRWFETQGMRAAMATAGDMDAMLLAGPVNQEFGRRIREEGLRSALEWRDGPYRKK